MNASLSAVLPVYNAQQDLARLALHLLEILPELTGKFELLIVDDGSNDETPDLARELAMVYPQVQFARHAARLGPQAAMRTALALSSGTWLLWRSEHSRLDLDEIRKLWWLRDEAELVLGSAAGEAALGRIPLVPPLEALPWPAAEPPLVLVARRLLLPWRAAEAREPWLSFALRMRPACREVELRTRTPARPPQRPAAPAERVPAPAGLLRKHAAYLDHIKAFALGE